MSSGNVNPCHSASSYAGRSAPKIAWPAVSSSGPTVLARKHADQQAGKHEQRARHEHALGLMRRARQVVARRAEEHLVDEAH